MLGTTATANDRVVEDVARQLGADVALIRGPLARDTLHLDAIPLRDQAERLAWLAEHLPAMPGAGIVYCLTVADTQRVAGWLRGRGIDARPYSADIAPEEREALEGDLLANRLKALVATVALGMGFDKPDLGFVVHYQRPASPIAYYQQVGRAGRAVERAYGILLSGREDDAIAEYFMATAFPPAARMKDILAALEKVDSATIRGLQAQVNLPYGQIEKALKLLEVDGAVVRERGRFVRTAMPWEQDEAWVAGCWRRGGASWRRCRRTWTRPAAGWSSWAGCSTTPPLGSAGTARTTAGCAGRVRSIRGAGAGGRDVPAAGRAGDRTAAPVAGRDEDRQAQRGGARAVHARRPRVGEGRGARARGCGHRGRGRRGGRGPLRGPPGRGRDGGHPWPVAPSPAPEWVTCVPSMSRPGLVEAFTERLASALALPFVPCVTSSADGSAQAQMANSAQQAANARRRLGVVAAGVRPGPYCSSTTSWTRAGR